MKKRIAFIWICLFASLSLSILCVCLATRRDGSRLAVANSVHDFGTLTQNTEVRAVFRLTNEFPVPVLIHEVIKDCDCAEAVADKMHLSPGDVAEIRVKWNTGVRRGDSSTGVVVYHRPMGSSLAPPRALRLTLRADVIPDFRYEPMPLRLTRVDREARIRFSPVHQKDFQVLRAYSSEPDISVSVTGGRDVVVMLSSSARSSSHSDATRRPQVTVVTNSRAEPEVRIPIWIEENRPAGAADTRGIDKVTAPAANAQASKR